MCMKNQHHLLMLKFSTNQNQITKCLPLRELTLKLNLPTVTVDEIYAEINAGQVWRKRPYNENRNLQINDVGSTVDYGVLPST